MAAAEKQQTFNVILDDLKIVAKAKQALHKDNSMHMDLQGIIERESARLEFHYKSYLKDSRLLITDRIRLEKLCDLLHDVYKARKSVFTIIIGDLQQEAPENPPRSPAQQTLLRLWQAMQAEEIESPAMHALIIDALLPRAPMVAATVGTDTLNQTATPALHGELREAPGPYSTISGTKTSPDILVTRSSSKRASSPAPSPSQAKVPKVRQKWSFKAESYFRTDLMPINYFQPSIVNIIFDPNTGESTLDVEDCIISRIMINSTEIKSPICYSRSKRAIRFTVGGNTVSFLMLTTGDGEGLLEKLKDLCPAIGHSNVGLVHSTTLI
ncbi:MAG: hypothetical protein LQ346_006173 [Caloplaca aetnensis]|nr:MAG: hypothetical protein LQ346_006173 [Caloplaca aetnensis]